MTDSGSDLMGEVDAILREHYYLKEPWEYTIAELWVFQALIAPILPAVFYLAVGGPFGSGKTNFIYLLNDLAGGVKFENVSIAAMAYTLGDQKHPCRPVAIDEITVQREKEAMAIRDALLRQGYKANAAPYTRVNDWQKKTLDRIPLFSAKVFGFTGTLEQALQSRCFPIASVIPKPGLDSYDYVRKNLWPHLHELPEKLKKWRIDAMIDWDVGRVEALTYTHDFELKMQEATKEIGANRESELTTIAMLVAEVLGVDVVKDLKTAQELRASELASAMANSYVDEFLSVLRAELKDLIPVDGITRIKQSDIKRSWDDQLKIEHHERAATASQFAELREAAGISRWMVKDHAGSYYWNLDAEFMTKLMAGASTATADEIKAKIRAEAAKAKAGASP